MAEARTRRLPDRIRRGRERHLERGRAYRILFAAAGFLLLAGGIAMLVLPGPGLLVMAIGFAMLALEFAWAERALERTVDRMDAAKDKAVRASRTQKLVAGVSLAACAAALLVAVILWDIPLIPFFAGRRPI